VSRAPSAGTLLAIGLALAFAPAVRNLAGAWSSAEHQSHGFLVALVSAAFAWSSRDRLARLPRHPDGRGALLLAVGLGVYAIALLAGSVTGQGLALVIGLSGLVGWLRGPAWLRALAFPLAYLLFMVPLPPEWIAPLVVRLLLWVSLASEWLLHAFGVAVTRSGNVLTLANGESLFIAEACSGLTSLVTMVPIAVLIAYLTPARTSLRVLLVLTVVPLAMVANLLRVVGTVLAAGVWDAHTVAADPWHTLAGLAVYAISCLGLLALAQRLREQPRRAP
jgi:exosortase